MSKQLAEILLRDKLINPTQFDQAISGASQASGSPIKFLIAQKIISESKLLDYLSKKYNLASINLSKFEIQKAHLNLMNGEQVLQFRSIPIQSKKDTVVIAVCDPTALIQLDKLKFVLKANVEAVLTTYSAFDEAVNKYYSSATSAISTALNVFGKEKTQKDANEDQGLELVDVYDIHHGVSTAEAADAPVITFVNGVLQEAVSRNASDIHVEPYEKRFRVRLRIDGSLIEVAEVPPAMKRAVIARIKIMSRMDISESRVPQDGRIKIKVGSKQVDFRVNSLPTLFGEKVVMRMLSSGSLTLDLEKLGFDKLQLEVFKKGIYAPNGMVLVTGPTGSGKTTTLYSALSELNVITDNISTAEDPVEYNLEGINQSQVNKDVGLTFASVLRAMLRQDPDTILVGEIRDYETAEVAIQAALTGHLVLSTLHTNDAPSTITRLMNMGVEPFLVTSSVNTIVAQRLLRRACPKCKIDATVNLEQLKELGVRADRASGIKLVKSKGCAHCNNTGYKGRVSVFEVLDFTTELKEMVLSGRSVIEIRKSAIQNGMRTLRESALERAFDGTTTLEESISATMDH